MLFPQRLHKVLDEGKYYSIISWQPHGRAFKVHKKEEFVKTVLPLFAKSGRTFASFQRQLNYYGFKRVDLSGPDKGSYYHPHFLRGCFDLCKDYMSRNQSALDKKGTTKNPGGSSTMIASGLDPKAAKGEDRDVLISPLPTSANPVHISKPFYNAEVYRSQWNRTHGKYPKSLDSATDRHRLSRYYLYPPSTPYSHLQYERQHNFSSPKLEREYRYDIHLDEIPQGRYPYRQYANLYRRSYNYPTWTSSEGITTTYTSSISQPTYQQDTPKRFFSKDGDNYNKEERQDYEDQIKTQSEDQMISAQCQNHETINCVPPMLENKNEKDNNCEKKHTTRNSSMSQSASSRSTVSPQFDDVSKGDSSIQHDRQDENIFPDDFHVTENCLETIQQQDNDFSSSNTPRASGSGGRQFWNSSNRQIFYDAVNDLIIGKESDAHSSIEKQLTEEIEPVPDTDILKILDNNSLRVSDSYEQDLMQASFSSFP